MVAAVIVASVAGVALSIVFSRSGETPARTDAPSNPALDALLVAARERAQDKAATSALRNALVAEKVIYVDWGTYGEAEADFDDNGKPDLAEVEPSIIFLTGLTPTQSGPVYVSVDGPVVFLAGRSDSGRCFYLRDNISTGIGYATDARCRPADGQRYGAEAWRF